MATVNSERKVPVKVNVSSGTPAALVKKFCVWDTNADRVITHVPGAHGAAAVGILYESVETSTDGEHESAMILPGCITKITLGEAVTTVGAALRIGGNSSETDGAAYLANATNDVIVGYALSTGAVGDVISFHFTGYSGLAA